MRESVSCSVVCDSWQPHGLWLARLLCPWDAPGQNTGVGSLSLLQGIFPTQGLNPALALQADSFPAEPQGSPLTPRTVPNTTVSFTLLLPPVFCSIQVFSSKLALCIRWPKYWSFNINISPSSEYSGLISFRIDGLISKLDCFVTGEDHA